MTTSTEFIQQGKDLMGKLKFMEAEDRFKKALEADSRSADALVWLGKLSLMKDQKEEGLRLIDQALTYQPRHAEALATKGIYYIQIADYQKAIDSLEEAKKADPKLEMTYYNLGKAYRELGQFDQAEEALRKAIELNPKQYQAHSELSYILGQTGRVAEGIREMVAAIKINPLYLKGYLVLGALYKNAGKGDLVIDLYKEGLRHNPNAIPLREELCAMYMLKMDLRAAYAEALEIVKRRKNFYGDYLRLGNLAIANGEFETAEKAYKTSIQLNPKSWEGHYNLGELYFSAKLWDQARAEYRAAIEHGADQWKPFNGMGLFVLHADHNTEEAIKFLTRALEITPGQKEPLFNMALACSVAKDFPNAEKFANTVLRLTKPEDTVHQEAERLLKEIETEKKKVN